MLLLALVIDLAHAWGRGASLNEVCPMIIEYLKTAYNGGQADRVGSETEEVGITYCTIQIADKGKKKFHQT